MSRKAGVPKSASFKFSVGGLDLASVGTILSWFLLAWIGRRTIFVWGLFILFVLVLLARNSSRPVHTDDQPKGGVVEPAPNGFICLPRSGTHDITDAEHHASMKSFGADLQNAIGAALPTRDEIRYSRVIVLLLSWEDDDLGVYREINQLEHVFANMYHFDVEKFEIPSLEPVMRVNECITGLIKRGGKDTLLIVYYGGHGRGVQYSTEAPIWFPNRFHPSIALPSGGIQCLLEEASSDVLLLYDCCHSATVPAGSSGRGGVTEVIAACGYETTAPEVDEHSFTKALLDILTVDVEFPFSVGRLHSRILSNLKCWSPGVRALNGQRLRQWQPRRTPVHTLLSETKPRRSIVLGPLPSQEQPPSNSPQEHRTPTSIGSTSSTPSTSDDESPSENGEGDSEGNRCAQILLAIRVDETSLDKDDWVAWMKTVPIDGREIHVEGRWGSFSTLLLLRMPVEVWNLLPENPAYSFVGFVTTENLADGHPPSNTNISDITSHLSLTSTPKSEPVLDSSVYKQSEVPVHSASSISPTPEDEESSSPLIVFDPIGTQQIPTMEIHHRAGLVARIRENIYNNIQQVCRGWNRTEADTLWEKVLFICGVFNILFSGYIIGGYPQYFHYFYTGQLLYLLPIRYYTFHERRFHFFLADLCYVVNILCMCTIWLFPRSTRLFIGTYCLAFGNNAISMTMWRSVMVFHSLDKVTTVFIHVMPCVALHCLVHLIPPDLQQERFPAIWAIKMLAPSLRVQDSLLAMTAWSTVPYFIWQLSYYLMITVWQREKIAAGYPTSYTWLRNRWARKKNARAPIGRVMLSLPESLQEPTFMMLQYIYVVLTTLPCLIWFWHRHASAAFLMVVYFGSVYNGATFYSEVFRKRNKNEEEAGLMREARLL